MLRFIQHDNSGRPCRKNRSRPQLPGQDRTAHVLTPVPGQMQVNKPRWMRAIRTFVCSGPASELLWRPLTV